MRALLLLLCLASPAYAQEPTPLKWPVDTRPVAERLSDATVAGAITLRTIASFRADDRRHAFMDQGCELAVAMGLAEVTKRIVRRPRPDGSDTYSFPSGHTTAAAASAGWNYSIGVPIAVGAGYFRMAANKHYASDVAAGLFIGLASTAMCRW